MELLAKAESTDSLIALEQRLSEIRYEIESISSQLRVYDNHVSYSTVNISLTEVKQITATADEGFAAQLRSGFTANMDRMGALFRNAALYILTALPFLFPVAALLVLVYSMIKIAGKLAGKKAETRSKKIHLNETGTKAGTEDETLSAGNNLQHADDKAGETELHR